MGTSRRRTPRRSSASTKSISTRNLKFHRPCGVPERVTNAKGKEKRVCRWYATPWQILRQLPNLAGHLKPDVTVDNLDAQARASSDTEAARQMQKAKHALFAGLRQKKSA